MKRFWLFAWSDYEAFGGMNDCKGSFDTLSQAQDFYKHLDLDRCHVYDSVKNTIVFSQED
jgi:hypothetical protein